MKKLIIIFFFVTILSVLGYSNQEQPKPPVGIIEKLGQTIPMEEEFYDEDGNLVSLKSIINKPTIVTFVYYKCAGICNPLLREMTDVVSKMDLTLGKDYQILTLSFDHNEKPELGKEKKENYLAEIKKPVNPNGWKFYTGDSANIYRVTDAAGFYFQRSGRDWIHAASLIVLSPQGKITRYLYGVQHLPFDVKMAVIEASEGKATPTIAKVLKFCYSYDPEGKRYAFNYLSIGFAATIGFVLIFIIIFLVRPKKKNSGKVSNV
ncbi:MAG: SCO family protein [Ignavibacteriales bacterium]|nr:SCO family protein [Ignavibacteriales bacterium]